MNKNALLKGIALGAGLIAGLIILLIMGTILFVMGSSRLNSSRLKSTSPLTHFIGNLEAKKYTDVSHFFDKPASKAEIFDVLKAQDYGWHHWKSDTPELDSLYDEYVFSRSLPGGCVWGHVNAALVVRFDKNDSFVSAKGHKSNCYK